jgi:hypothetical protein
LLQQLQALGLDVPTVLQQLGIRTNGGTVPAAPAAEPEPPRTKKS